MGYGKGLYNEGKWAEGYRMAVVGWGNVNSVAIVYTWERTRGGSHNGGVRGLARQPR